MVVLFELELGHAVEELELVSVGEDIEDDTKYRRSEGRRVASSRDIQQVPSHTASVVLGSPPDVRTTVSRLVASTTFLLFSTSDTICCNNINKLHEMWYNYRVIHENVNFLT